jgi:hypothetical protein
MNQTQKCVSGTLIRSGYEPDFHNYYRGHPFAKYVVGFIRKLAEEKIAAAKPFEPAKLCES